MTTKHKSQSADSQQRLCSADTATEVMLAHQYLYYVASNPIWSDYEYDQFCDRNDLEGNGGSDLASDYSEKVKRIAKQMLANPRLYPPNHKS